MFTEIDHAAAAKQATQRLRPRTVVAFDNPSSGTAPMQREDASERDDEGYILVGDNCD